MKNFNKNIVSWIIAVVGVVCLVCFIDLGMRKLGIDIRNLDAKMARLEQSVEDMAILESEAISSVQEIGVKDVPRDILLAREAFEKANSDEELHDLRNIYYINAINNDPENIDYYKGYYEYLKEVDNLDGLDYLYRLISNNVLYLPSTITTELIDMRDEIDTLINGLIVPNTQSSIDYSQDLIRLDTAYKDYRKFISNGNLNLNDFYSTYNLFVSEYEKIPEYLTMKYVVTYNDLAYLKILMDSYRIVFDVTNYLHTFNVKTDLENFLFAYDSYSYVYANMMQLLQGDKAGVSSNVIPVINLLSYKVFEKSSEIDKLYSEALLSPLKETLIGLETMSKNLNKNNYDEFMEAYDKCMIEYAKISTRLGVAYASEDILPIVRLFEDIKNEKARYDRKNYQLWAAEVIRNTKEEMENSKKDIRYSCLYKNGFWNIDKNQLISNLVLLYDDILKNCYRDNSSADDDELMKQYPVDTMLVGDYERMVKYI